MTLHTTRRRRTAARRSTAPWLVISLLATQSNAVDTSQPWSLPELGAPPVTEPADAYGATGVQAVFFTGEHWQGKPTKDRKSVV